MMRVSYCAAWVSLTIVALSALAWMAWHRIIRRAWRPRPKDWGIAVAGLLIVSTGAAWALGWAVAVSSQLFGIFFGAFVIGVIVDRVMVQDRRVVWGPPRRTICLALARRLTQIIQQYHTQFDPEGAEDGRVSYRGGGTYAAQLLHLPADHALAAIETCLADMKGAVERLDHNDPVDEGGERSRLVALVLKFMRNDPLVPLRNAFAMLGPFVEDPSIQPAVHALGRLEGFAVVMTQAAAATGAMEGWTVEFDRLWIDFVDQLGVALRTLAAAARGPSGEPNDLMPGIESIRLDPYAGTTVKSH